MSNKRTVKVIKKAEVAEGKTDDQHQRDHEIGLLHHLVRKHPVKAKFFLEQLGRNYLLTHPKM